MKTIAIVDDDLPISNMLAELLQKAGYAVLQAYSGTEALYLLSQHRPDLIVLDLMLPGRSGRRFCRKWQAFRSLYSAPRWTPKTKSVCFWAAQPTT